MAGEFTSSRMQQEEHGVAQPYPVSILLLRTAKRQDKLQQLTKQAACHATDIKLIASRRCASDGASGCRASSHGRRPCPCRAPSLLQQKERLARKPWRGAVLEGRLAPPCGPISSNL